MNSYKLIIIAGAVLLLLASVRLAAGGKKAPPSDVQTIPWVVITPGGCGASTNYQLCETVEPAAGIGKSTNYYLITGFWAAFGGGVTCCNHDGIRGDADSDGSLNIADVIWLVDYIFFGGPPPPCFEEGDVNGDGAINIADAVHIVQYIFFGGPPPAPC